MVTDFQMKILRRMVATSGHIFRTPGGFWVTDPSRNVEDQPLVKNAARTWCDIRTVRALERQGLIERIHQYPEEWRDTRRLTVEGAVAAIREKKE